MESNIRKKAAEMEQQKTLHFAPILQASELNEPKPKLKFTLAFFI